MKFLRRKKRESLSELQGVPNHTFRCEVCKFIMPLNWLCGTVADLPSNSTPKVYILCSVCAIWLGFEMFHFPQGLCHNFTEEQRRAIKALHKELEVADKGLIKAMKKSITYKESGNTEAGLEVIHNFNEKIPHLVTLINLRFDILPNDTREPSDRLTRGEFVDPSEIKKAIWG